MFAQELPVKLTAAISLGHFLKNKTVVELLKPALDSLLTVYLKMISEIDSEMLVFALETVMQVFKDDMGPHAVRIADSLVTQYRRLIQVDMEEDDGESALAAVGCVTAIRRLLDSVNKNPGMIAQLEKVIFPIMMHGLSIDGMDSIEDILDCISIIIYYGGAVS